MSDISDDEAPAPLPSRVRGPPAHMLNRRRCSVSAEAMGRFAAAHEAKQDKIVHPKSDDAKERIRRATNKNLLFRDLEEDQRVDLENAMFEVDKPAGSVIIEQGDEGDNFYVLESGSCEVRITREGAEKVVGEIDAGGCFGELALMYNTPRAATIIAQTAVRLWAIDRVTFRRILLITTLNRRKKFESFLADVPVLKSLTAYERATLSDALLPRSYSEGEVIIRQGETGEEFYIVESGCAVMRHAEDPAVPPSQGEVIGELGPGDYCGEVALIKDQPRACSVIADSPQVKVVYLDRSTFVRLMGPALDMLQRNMSHYKQLTTRKSYADLKAAADEEDAEPPTSVPRYQRSRRGGVSAGVTQVSTSFRPPVHQKDDVAREHIRRAITQNALFSHLSGAQLDTVVDAMFEKRYRDGDLIIRQGDDGDNFYVVDTGECAIDITSRDGETRTVGTLREGGSMGELALMYNCPRAATIRAIGDVTCWAVDGDTFRHILASSALSQRKKYEAFLEKVPILSSLTQWERATIADALKEETYPSGAMIVRQGDAGDKFYIVVEGECCAQIEDAESGVSTVVKEYAGSDYFGEIALLTDAPRKATVIAKTITKAVYLDRPAFQRLLGSVDDILKRNMANYTSLSKQAGIEVDGGDGGGRGKQVEL